MEVYLICGVIELMDVAINSGTNMQIECRSLHLSAVSLRRRVDRQRRE